MLEAAARIFRAEGFDATTNRIAELAGVSIGSLYEYFPNKEALLVALAERHVQSAEQGIAAALAAGGTDQALLAALQAAIIVSHRYPSQALELVADARAGAELRTRALALRERVLAALCERARGSGLSEPELRARAIFGAIAELSSRTVYEAPNPEAHAALAHHLLAMGLSLLEPRSGA
jgi:AcrR family transcriptional regulator